VTAPRFLIRDRDRVYGPAFKTRVECMGIEEVVTAPRSPSQNPYADRMIGTIQRECLDHVVVLGERHLRRLLAEYRTTTVGAATARSRWTARLLARRKVPSSARWSRF